LTDNAQASYFLVVGSSLELYLHQPLTTKQVALYFFALQVACFPAALFGQTSQLPTAATDATVKADSVTVFEQMDISSDPVSTLKKGIAVYIDLRVDESGKGWCGIRPSAQANRIGFVDCRSLERVTPPIPAGRDSANFESVHGSAAEIPLERPATPTANGYASMKNEVVKEGVIDSGFIATLEAQASRGGPTALTRAALAHLAAGEFELQQHEPDKALEQFEAMEPFAGRQRDLSLASLDGRIYAELMKSEYSTALELIEKARKLSPGSANLAAWSGYTHYRMNQLDAAVEDLQAAQKIRPNQSVAALLEKAERDKDAEGDFREGESSHFVLRYHGGASRQLASEVIHTLEDQFQVLKSELRYTPPEQIGVILYTQETFFDVTRVPGWAGGLNDGRIRVPVQGLETVSDLLVRILKHELTHSFVFQKTSGRCPTWLQEGVAQWMEDRRTGADAAQLVAFYQDGKGKSLRYLDGPWMVLSSGQARYAYAWALAVVEAIEADSGSDGLDRLLDAERTEASGENALLQALRTNYASLDDSTAEFLRRTYLQ
jgi:tetratricopeptide (TPR) repeat protein